MSLSSRKLGAFSLPLGALREPDGMQNLFAGMVVVRATEDFSASKVRYIAWHEQFRSIGQGQIVPEYEATFGPNATTPVWREVRA